VSVGCWSGDTSDGIAHGEISVRLLSGRPEQAWWLGMTHFYLSMNYLEASQFDKGLEEAARAGSAGRDIDDPRLQTYAGYMTGWIEASRGRTGTAVEICRISLEKAPDRVSRVYAALFLGYALLEHGEHGPALEQLQHALDELVRFDFPQWQSLASVFVAECLRREGRREAAGAKAGDGLAIAAQVGYWYGIGMGERIVARIARDSGRMSEAAEAFRRSADAFQRIGSSFEATRTREEASGKTQ
jgi:hypothetical protein